jgi:serine phosphatase RsbU (regulator of sigma subunit)
MAQLATTNQDDPFTTPEVAALAAELAELRLVLQQKEAAWAQATAEYQEMIGAYEEVNRLNLASALKLKEQEQEMLHKNQQLNEYAEELRATNTNLSELNNRFRTNENELKYKNGLLNESVEQLQEMVEAYEELNRRNVQSAAQLMERERELQEKNQLLAQVYRKVSESIQYAERIQKAMMPTEDELRRLIPESFLFFRPRDVVSGDFYWVAKHNYKIFVVVGDCTGHGVPGSFMSTIGITLLYDILNVMGSAPANEVLQELDKRLRLLLRQADGKNNDGIEMSICVIDDLPPYAPMKPRRVAFASAGNSLRYFKDGQLCQIDGDKASVGQKFKGVPASRFSQHLIDIDVPTTFYLASDGYHDQLGGAESRRFMRSRFNQLLQSCHHLPLDQQPALLEGNLRAWQGQEKQTDDIIVLGFRVLET